MFGFSIKSQENLDSCHSNLITLMEAALKNSPVDFSIICGYRGEKEQNEAQKNGYSQLRYPHSKHNKSPSLACDIQPYPYTKEAISDKKNKIFRLLNDHIKKVANDLGIPVINGGLDWNYDWFHWELVL